MPLGETVGLSVRVLEGVRLMVLEALRDVEEVSEGV